MKSYINELMSFLNECPSSFHSVNAISKILLDNGFTKLIESESFKINKNGKYFITRNGTSIIAFKVGDFHENDYSFNIAASHSDSPSFKVKPNANLIGDKALKISVEPYGGMLCSTWFDRPLSLAGRVMVSTENGLINRLINFDQDLLMLPSVAIHQNREANNGYKYNFAVDMNPLLSLDTSIKLEDLIAKELDVKVEDIVSHDLFLYVRDKAITWGLEKEFISSSHLDDLECAYTTLMGFIEADNNNSVNVYCCFDNEEVGSLTRQGAASTFLHDILRRINSSLGLNEDDYYKAISSSFMVSADNAHAVHPNHPEYADQLNKVYVNSGIVIKYNASQSYTSDGISSSYFKHICNKANVPFQLFTNRSDLRGGSTLGNISNGQVSLMSVDIGLPQYAMHSSYETAGTKDIEYMIRAIKHYYSSSIRINSDGDILYK